MQQLLMKIKLPYIKSATTSATILTFGFSILVLVINMLTGILTARYLGPFGRGEQTAMVIWSQFLAFSMAFGIPSALIFNIKKFAGNAPQLYITSLRMGVAFGVLAMGFGIVLLPIWLKSFSEPVILFAQCSMVLCPFFVISQINNAAMQVRGEYKQYNKQRYLAPLCTLTGLALLIVTGTMNAYTSALAYLLPSIPFITGTTVRLLRAYKPVQKTEGWQSYRKLISYGMGSYGNDLMGNVSYYVDQIIIAGMLNAKHLGLYAVAVSLSRMVNIFSTSIIAVLFPKASGLEKEQAVALTFRVFRISTFVALLASICLMIVAPFVFQVLYGAEFKEALGVFRLLLLEVSIGGGTMVLAQVFMAMGKPKIVTLLQAIGLLLVIPLLMLLVPRFGLIGAGAAMLSSVLLRFGFILLNVRFILRMKIPPLVMTMDDLRWLKSMLDRKRGAPI
jgi:O-antigen/teichoic acid export membrane protein